MPTKKRTPPRRAEQPLPAITQDALISLIRDAVKEAVKQADRERPYQPGDLPVCPGPHYPCMRPHRDSLGPSFPAPYPTTPWSPILCGAGTTSTDGRQPEAVPHNAHHWH